MIALPCHAAVARTAEERATRAALLRQILGPVTGWSADWRTDLRERAAIAELDGGVDPATAEREAADAVRAELLRKLS